MTYRRRRAPGLLAGHAILVMLASVACLRSAHADPAATPVPDAQPAVVIATGGAPAATPSVKHHTRRHGAHDATDAARGPHDATARHAFDDVAHWSRVFDDPERDAWQKPAELVAALGLAPGATVADLGAGTGYFARHLVNAVGPRGTVLAADTEPALVDHLRRRAEQEGFANLVPILASADNPRLPTGTSDVVLIVDTWHHIDDRVAYARRLSSALATTGRVVIVDWQKHDLPVGPPPDHKLAREQVIDELTQAGYRLVAEPDVLPYQYVLVFAPAAQ